MIFSCDKDKPEKSTCEDLPQHFRASKGMIGYESSTRHGYTPATWEEESTTPNPLDLKFATTTLRTPWLISSTPSHLIGKEALSCPEQCPAGPPGPPGPVGPEGLPGLPVRFLRHIQFHF